jgi:hypothetical protein
MFSRTSGTTDEMMNGSQYHPSGGVGNRGDTSMDENSTYHAGAEPDIPGKSFQRNSLEY